MQSTEIKHNEIVASPIVKLRPTLPYEGHKVPLILELAGYTPEKMELILLMSKLFE
jgi:hypothetical protein